MMIGQLRSQALELSLFGFNVYCAEQQELLQLGRSDERGKGQVWVINEIVGRESDNCEVDELVNLID